MRGVSRCRSTRRRSRNGTGTWRRAACDALNWGFLGFYAIRETDAESGIVTYTQYRLDYPHFGKPARVSRYDGEYGTSPETLWERYVTYENNRIRHASRNRTDLPQVRFETDLIHEGGTQLGATHTKYALELTSDGYPETLERTTKAGHSVTPRDPPPNRDRFWGNSRMFTVDGLQRRTITETVFRNRTGTHWLIGFADYVTVRQGTGSAERTIKTDPAPYGDTNAVDTATRFPGDVNLEFTTNHDYDGYGNREETIVTAAHADSRETSIGGFAAARYPTSITNAAKHVEQLEHDARLGLPIKATDANNRVARLKYDALGREVERGSGVGQERDDDDFVRQLHDVRRDRRGGEVFLRRLADREAGDGVGDHIADGADDAGSNVAGGADDEALLRQAGAPDPHRGRGVRGR